MASRLFARRHNAAEVDKNGKTHVEYSKGKYPPCNASHMNYGGECLNCGWKKKDVPKKATTLVSKQTLEQAIQEAQGLVEQLITSNAHDARLDQLEEAISFLTSIIKKTPVEMQQEGAATLDDYLDDAVMPDMAQKIKQDVDMIAKMKNAGNGALPAQEPVMASTGNDSWTTDRDEKGEPKAPEQVEIPSVSVTAAKKKAEATPVAAPAAPAKPSADITQLSSDTLAKMQKALAGSEDLMNDKAAQAFIAAIAEELMNRPVEMEQPKVPAAGAAPAAAASAIPVAASFHGLTLASSEGEDEEENKQEKVAKAPEGWEGAIKDMKKDHGVDNPFALAWWMKDKGYKSHKGSEVLKQYGGASLVAAMNTDLQRRFASGSAGSWFSNDGDTGEVKEDGGRLPEVAEAHSSVDDNTGIKRPATTLPIKLSSDMTTSKALKLVERVGNDLKALYFEAKPVTEILDSRPVREAVESIYRSYDMIGEAAKVLNKQNMQEQNEAEAVEVKEKNKKKSATFLGLAVADEDDDDDGDTCNECGRSWGRCNCEKCPKCHQLLSACECDIE